jgi:hypothetical protein
MNGQPITSLFVLGCVSVASGNVEHLANGRFALHDLKTIEARA